MIIVRRAALVGAVILVFSLVGNRCFADSNETGPDEVYVAYKNGIVKDTGTGLEWVVPLRAPRMTLARFMRQMPDVLLCASSSSLFL
jgi:hypothetical protein